MKNVIFKRAGAAPGWVIWSGVFVLVFGSIFALAYLGGGGPLTGSGSSRGGDSPETALLLDAVSPSDWIKGTAQSPVVLLEYGDYQCPACAAYHGFVEQLVKDLGDKVAFVYRNFPLRNIHQHADLAARSAEAAGKQGKFWEMHNLIFEHQKEWSSASDAPELFLNYAKALGLDTVTFKKDQNSDAVKNKIESDLESGVRAEIQGTPTFYINGKKIDNPFSYNEFKNLVLQAGGGSGSSEEANAKK